MAVIAQQAFPKKVYAKIKSYRPYKFQYAFEREVFFFLALGSSAYFFVALFSFHPFDPSEISVGFPFSEPLNLAGSLGAKVAAACIYCFGLSAYLLPLPIMTSSTQLLLNRPQVFSLSRLLGWLIILGCSGAIFAAYLPQVSIANVPFASGGWVGESIAHTIQVIFGSVGKVLLFLTLTLCALMMVIRKGLIENCTEHLQLRQRFDQLWHRRKNKLESIPVAQSEPQEVFRKEPLVDKPIILATEASVPPTVGRSFSLFGSRPKIEKKVTSSTHDDNYQPPATSIFKMSEHNPVISGLQKKQFESTAKILCETFEDFGIKGKVVAIQPGPVLAVYEFQPDSGTKISKINSLVDDLALALKVDSIRMNPVRGKRAIGIEIPNAERLMVYLGDILESDEYKNSESHLTLALGKTITGKPVTADLTKMPHLLIAGATGAGKSVAINGILCSIIMKSSPQQVKMILVDPKMLELSVYEGIPHLLMPVITNANRASLALKWACCEMDRRYKLMQLAQVRNIDGFNSYWRRAGIDQKEELRELSGVDDLGELPLIMFVIDELADLMLNSPKEVETQIQRLAQKARASGIHLILATQRPSVDIITGVIKANLPCRAAFQVVSKHDSRTILDQIGADKLLGNGDMLLQKPGTGRLERVQGAFISDEEVLNMVKEVKENSQTSYNHNLINWIEEEAKRQSADGGPADSSLADDDPKFDLAVEIAANNGAISASYLQRQLKIGYNRAARIVETMEIKGMVDKADGSKPRKWLGPTGDY